MIVAKIANICGPRYFYFGYVKGVMVAIECLGVVKSLIGLFDSIPPVIWSGVIGSMLALSGVYLTSKNSYKNLKIQLKHDSNEKSTERSMRLRQETYVLVANELVSAQHHLANIPMTEIFKENPANGVNAFLRAATQCQLVSSPRTAMLMLKYIHGFGRLVARAISSIDKMASAGTAADLAKALIDKNQSEFDKTMSKLNEINQELGNSKANYDSLKNYAEFYKEQMAKGWEEHIAAVEERSQHTLSYSRNLIKDLIALVPDQIEVLVSMRTDLGFDSDVEEYRKLLLEQQEEMLQEMEESFAKMANVGH